MGMNYYRVPKLAEEDRKELQEVLKDCKSPMEIVEASERKLYKYAGELGYDWVTSEDGVHIGKASVGWKFQFDGKMLMAILMDHPEIKERKLPTDQPLYDKADFFSFRTIRRVDMEASDDLKKVTQDDIKQWLAEGIVYDEDEKEVSVDELFEKVKEKEDGMDNKDYKESHPDEHAYLSQVYVDGLFFCGDICDWS